MPSAAAFKFWIAGFGVEIWSGAIGAGNALLPIHASFSPAFPPEPIVLNLCQLLLALAGQYINYTPEWQTTPEVTLAPRVPSPFDSWNLATTPRFGFVSTDWTSDGEVEFLDTVTLSWQAAGGVFEEIHLGSERTSNRSAKTWVKAWGVDTLRAKKGQAAADSLRKWTRLNGPEPWSPLEVVLCHDTIGGRSCVDSSYWMNQGSLYKDAQWILEKVDANGYLVRRDSIILVSGLLIVLSRDSVRVESNGKPLESIHWAYSGADQSLAENARVENFWNGNQLVRVKTTTITTYERNLFWGADGRLDSSIIPLMDDGYRFQYDAQGRMVGQTFSFQRNRMDLDANGRLIALRADIADGPDRDRYREYALDSFVLDAQGRLLESVRCLDYMTDSLLDRSNCSRRTYEYNVSVSIHRTPSIRAAGQVRREGSRLVAQGISGRPLTLKILRPDGRVERTEKAMGEMRLEIRDLPKGLLLWSLESEGSAQASGRIWLPAR